MGVSIFNTGYDLQDQIDAAESAIAIVSIGDTHVAITSGQYVYVREHGTLAEGLYRATANIAANGTLSGSNVTAVSGGGLNALNSNTCKKTTYANITGSNIASITVQNSYKYMITCVGSQSAVCAVLLVYVSSNGGVSVNEVTKGSNISIATSNNNVTITNTNTNYPSFITCITLYP